VSSSRRRLAQLDTREREELAAVGHDSELEGKLAVLREKRMSLESDGRRSLEAIS
jgi:hypothetical protein